MENINISEKKFSSLSKPDTVRMSNDFRFEFLNYIHNPELLSASIITYRILFKIIADLRNNNFNNSASKLNDIQFSLFEKEFKTLDNTYARFEYKISELDKNRNYKAIEGALSFLTDYKKQWYTHTNQLGKQIKSYGGLISEPNYTKGKVSFLISSYWMEKLLLMNEYNDVLYSIIDNLKDPKQLHFYLWILSLKEEGTRVRMNMLVERFKLNYISYNSLYKDFLYPLRKKFNKISNVSFNCNYDGNLISISKQYLVPNIEDFSSNTVNKLTVKQKSHYLKLRHKLTDNDFLELKKSLSNRIVFEKITIAYKDFVKDCRKNKIKSDTITGEQFMNNFKQWITK
ncbi:hypothetical protein V3471_15040 [Flavobacterium oreochromis]|uniref:hypothetical protein n=1 Tax=Flavobacterium oreochromis TaxID=2906078 RepID=UPI00385FAFC4